MWMMKCHTDFDPTIFKRKNILDARTRPDLRRAISPHSQKEFDVIERESAQRLVGVLSENNNLTNSFSRCGRHK
jgi:hypothetical protein